MKIRLQSCAYSIIICLLLLFNSNSANAQYTDTVTYQYTQNSGSCKICGGDYSCFTNSQQLLIGQNSSQRISKIKILVYHTSCGTGDFFSILNGDTIGSFNRSYNCSCSDCFVDSIEAVFPNLNAYIPNDTNILKFVCPNTCVDRIVVIRTFSPSATDDAAVLSIDSPYRVCAGVQSVVATIANFGINVIDSVRVNWSYNSITQTPIYYSTPLDTIGGSGNFKAQVFLGNKTLVAKKTDTIQVWTSMPNGNNDTTNLNDTIKVFIQPSLKDTLTIGGSSPDYSSIQDAINDLQLYGVCGPVVLNLRAGTYSEQITIGEIPGSDSINTITIRSETGDSSDVNINYSSSLSNSNYTILLNNASNIIFTQLTIEAGGTSYSRAISVQNSFNRILFKNCLITGYASSSSSTNQALVYANSMAMSGKQLIFEHCEIRDGSYGVYLSNMNSSNGVAIESCRIIGQRYANIYFSSLANIHVNNCELSRITTTYSYGYGAYAYNCSKLMISNNRIWQPNGAYSGIYISKI
ncbi:MAG: right-handed parallel beta-helix repeat-containing protein [Bacteroidia bacterium]